MIEYHITMKIGEYLRNADCLMNVEELIYQIGESKEYVRLKITYEVSLENKWYYSENGKLYEKEGAGFWESTRLFRVWQARKDD